MKRFYLIIACIMGFTSIQAQLAEQAKMELMVDIVYLSSDLLGGRESGTPQEKMAADYIAHRFEESGLSPKGTKGWMQPFDFDYRPNPHGPVEEKRTGHNVVGYLDNGAETTVVIGAHYDHLGMGHFGSRHTGEPAIHNGADDNASGVAAMFQVAEVLGDPAYANNNYLFIAFSGEELGLYGSKFFVSNPTIDLRSVNYMLNMDMIGRLNEEGSLVINGAGTSPLWKETFETIEAGNIKVKTTDSGIGPSDHTSFYLEDIPAIHFFTGQHMDYHKPEDDSELVNFEGVELVSEYIVKLIGALDDDGRIAFSKTKDETEESERMSFKVTLGVMPDYVYDGEGMRVDGVISNRPAENAGMERGDIIVMMGGEKIVDIFDYMEGLGKFEPGDETIVTVKRGEELVELKVVF
ncbi:MAG: M28 family peptidase [Bacteroidetes bacterium]|nr:M28 family peptidase [Bacteroidota bacterium]